MPLDVGRVTHLLEQMHRSEDDSGDPIAVDKVLVTDGARGFTWEDYGDTGTVTPIDHGNMGATETFDIAAGTWHRGTLDADCTFTITGFAIDEGIVALLEITQDGTGGWAITWDADVDFGGADDQPNQDIDGYTAYVLWSSEGDSTIYGAKVGSGGGGTPATTVESETSFGITPAVGTDTEYARQDHTHGSPGDDELQAAGHYEVMMDGSSPPAPLENGSGTDWLYVWVPG